MENVLQQQEGGNKKNNLFIVFCENCEVAAESQCRFLKGLVIRRINPQSLKTFRR